MPDDLLLQIGLVAVVVVVTFGVSAAIGIALARLRPF
jgi:hypothetical protein